MIYKLLAAALLGLLSGPAAAQERPRGDVTVPRWHFEQEFRLPDSLLHDAALEPPRLHSVEELERGLTTHPLVPMSSVTVVLRDYLPVGTVVLPNNTLHLGRHFILSNGQAWDWVPGPAGYLDARTISLPLP